MKVNPITPEEAEEYDDKVNTYALDVEIPTLDAKFIEMFHKLEGNGTEAYVAAISPKKIKRSSARTYASKLMTKYNLRSKMKDARNKVKVKDIRTTIKPRDELIRYVKKQYEVGVLNEQEVWDRMSELARYATSETVQKQAVETMYAWIKEAKQELAASELSEQDIVSLCIDAISALPKEKYLGVLKGARKKRQELIQKRTEVFDADKIRAEERDRASL